LFAEAGPSQALGLGWGLSRDSRLLLSERRLALKHDLGHHAPAVDEEFAFTLDELRLEVVGFVFFLFASAASWVS